jgi:hypothetical protein
VVGACLRFSGPNGYQSITATVTAPTISVSNTTIGQYMQGAINVSLQTAPLTPITVTVTTGNLAAVVISKSGTTAGSTTNNTLTFTNVTTASIGQIYVQGQSLGAGGSGTSTITVTAPGYTNGTGTVTVNPSDFVINPGQGNISTTPTSPATTVTVDPSGFIISSGNITTTPTSSPTTVTVAPAVLTPGLLTFYGYGELSPGAGPYPYALTVSSGAGTVGTISTSPVNLYAGDTSDTPPSCRSARARPRSR